jgi:hypothetical protein
VSTTTQEETIQCADELSTLIADQEKSNKNMYDYLRTDYLKSIEGKVLVKGTIILVIMGTVYTEYLMRYGSLSTPIVVQKNAFYVAVAAGSKITKNINSDTNLMGAIYTVLSNLSRIIKDLSMTVDEIKEIMNLLSAPEADFDNIDDVSVNIALQGINNDFPFLAMTVDSLNAGGDKSEDGVYKVNTKALLSVFFKNLTISSSSEVAIEPEMDFNIDSDSLISIDGNLTIIGSSSALVIDSGSIIIENGGTVTLTDSKLLNYGDTIEVIGDDSFLTLAKEGQLINSDSCSIIINGGPLDIEGETFTNNDPVMYVPDKHIIIAACDDNSIFAMYDSALKNDIKELFTLNSLDLGNYSIYGFINSKNKQYLIYVDWNGDTYPYNFLNLVAGTVDFTIPEDVRGICRGYIDSSDDVYVLCEKSYLINQQMGDDKTPIVLSSYIPYESLYKNGIEISNNKAAVIAAISQCIDNAKSQYDNDVADSSYSSYIHGFTEGATVGNEPHFTDACITVYRNVKRNYLDRKSKYFAHATINVSIHKYVQLVADGENVSALQGIYDYPVDEWGALGAVGQYQYIYSTTSDGINNNISSNYVPSVSYNYENIRRIKFDVLPGDEEFLFCDLQPPSSPVKLVNYTADKTVMDGNMTIIATLPNNFSDIDFDDKYIYVVDYQQLTIYEKDSLNVVSQITIPNSDLSITNLSFNVNGKNPRTNSDNVKQVISNTIK